MLHSTKLGQAESNPDPIHLSVKKAILYALTLDIMGPVNRKRHQWKEALYPSKPPLGKAILVDIP